MEDSSRSPLETWSLPYEEFYASADQIMDQSNTLLSIAEVHLRALDESFRRYSYDYARDIMITNYNSTVNPEATIYATVVHNFDGVTLLKDAHCMVILDGHHRYPAVRKWRDENSVDWSAEKLRKRFAFQVDAKTISPA